MTIVLNNKIHSFCFLNPWIDLGWQKKDGKCRFENWILKISYTYVRLHGKIMFKQKKKKIAYFIWLNFKIILIFNKIKFTIKK